MLFDCGTTDVFESEKERNLYYKFFCGYFFNEFVPGLDDRLNELCRLLETPAYPTPSDLIHYRPADKLHLTAKNSHVSFDNHSYLFEGSKDHRGEFADIFVHDRSTRTLICMEAKLHGDWEYQKDIQENARRVKEIADRLGTCIAVHCLLVKKKKLDDVQKQKNRKGSNWKCFEDDAKSSTMFVTWEQFAEICDDPSVRKYLELQLKRHHSVKYKVAKNGSFAGG